MFPIRDSIPSGSISFVNYAILALCSFAFYAQISGGQVGQQIAEQYGMVPLRITRPDEAAVMVIREAVQTPDGIFVRERERELAPAALPVWLKMLARSPMVRWSSASTRPT